MSSRETALKTLIVTINVLQYQKRGSTAVNRIWVIGSSEIALHVSEKSDLLEKLCKKYR